MSASITCTRTTSRNARPYSASSRAQIFQRLPRLRLDAAGDKFECARPGADLSGENYKVADANTVGERQISRQHGMGLQVFQLRFSGLSGHVALRDIFRFPAIYAVNLSFAPR